MEGSKFKRRHPDQTGVFYRDAPLQSVTPPAGLTDRHIKTATAPPTGSPTLAPRSGYRHRPEDDILVQPLSQSGYLEAPRANNVSVLPAVTSSTSAKSPSSGFNDLPVEIHDAIIDHLIGPLGSLGSSFSDGPSRNWGNAMRHPRRKQMSDLALVSRIWKPLIQERLYRHIKIKGTRSELGECGDWFLTHTVFQSYVKHVEVWVPLFEVSLKSHANRVVLREPPSPNRDAHTAGSYISYPENIAAATRSSRTLDNATLEEIFSCAKGLFSEARILTIEGGHCKKSRKIPHFRTIGSDFNVPCLFNETAESCKSTDFQGLRRFPQHQTISTLILKGSWNIIRCTADFQYLAVALPSIREWHCVYAKPKTDAYIAICGILRSFPTTITKVDLCLEGLNGKQPSSLKKWRKLFPEFHICKDLGRIVPQLESLSYTGHICGAFFKTANAVATKMHDKSRLKSIDLFVRNVCRDTSGLEEGPSIYNWSFIQAFEHLVLEAVPSLDGFPELKYVRVRFLDLDSPRPLLNPYWHYENNLATGLWSWKIVDALVATKRKPRHEPSAGEDFSRVGAPGWTRGRPQNLFVGSYEPLARVF